MVGQSTAMVTSVGATKLLIAIEDEDDAGWVVGEVVDVAFVLLFGVKMGCSHSSFICKPIT